MSREDILTTNLQTGLGTETLALEIGLEADNTSLGGFGHHRFDQTPGFSAISEQHIAGESEAGLAEDPRGFIKSAFDSAADYIHQLPGYRKVVASFAAAGLAVAGTAGAAGVSYHPRSNEYVKKHCKDRAIADTQSGKNRVQDDIHVWVVNDNAKKGGPSRPHFYFKLLKGQDLCRVKFDRRDGKKVVPTPNHLTKTGGDFVSAPGNTLKSYTTMYVDAER